VNDVIGVCVRDDAQLRDVVSGPQGLLSTPMHAGSVIAVHSTVHPNTCRELAKQAKRLGVDLIDAAISKTGGLIAVGGDDATVDRCYPYLRALGENVVHAGAVGSGQVVKLIKNLVMAATMGVTTEALQCGVAAGINRDVLVRALQVGDGLSALRTYLATDRASHNHPLLSKDVAIALEELSGAGCDAPILRTSSEAGLDALGANASKHSGDGAMAT
jgi:3-hydroxyisobutyrate dehydrogenase-like beta-hydroxyacid dehydrogenase